MTSVFSPLEFPENFGKPNFHRVGSYVRDECSIQFASGNYTCLQGYFSIKREIGFYWLYAFLPSIMCVIISWSGFWINVSNAPARVGLGITTFLSIKSLSQSFSVGMPKASYIKVQ